MAKPDWLRRVEAEDDALRAQLAWDEMKAAVAVVRKSAAQLHYKTINTSPFANSAGEDQPFVAPPELAVPEVPAPADARPLAAAELAEPEGPAAPMAPPAGKVELVEQLINALVAVLEKLRAQPETKSACRRLERQLAKLYARQRELQITAVVEQFDNDDDAVAYAVDKCFAAIERRMDAQDREIATLKQGKHKKGKHKKAEVVDLPKRQGAA